MARRSQASSDSVEEIDLSKNQLSLILYDIIISKILYLAIFNFVSLQNTHCTKCLYVIFVPVENCP